jgi:isocitrate/isopropylmalate dehydrogenase
MKKKIAVILGDGIGPEVTHQSMKVLDTIAKQFNHRVSADLYSSQLVYIKYLLVLIFLPMLC